MKRKRGKASKYYVQPFSIGLDAWPFTFEEILRMARYVGIAGGVVWVVVREMFAFLEPGSAAAGSVPFFVFMLLLVPVLHGIRRLLRPSDIEIARRWDYILSHPEEYPGEASVRRSDHRD